MAGIWVYSEIEDTTNELLSVGRKIANEMGSNLQVIALPGQNCQSFISKGADKVIQLTKETTWIEDYAKVIVEILRKEGTEAFIVGGSLRGKTTAAYVATALATGLVNNAFSIKVEAGKVITQRVIYSGIAVCTEELISGSVITVEPHTYESPQDDQACKGEIIQCDINPESKIKTVDNICQTSNQTEDITAADKIVCIGRGLSGKEDVQMAEKLAQGLGAQMACTRSVAEDYHWLPTERYIGLSGAKVKPQLYLSIGVSGQVQHVAGMRGAKIIAAIDKNENAPIFSAADYGIVGDLHEIVPLLLKALAK